MKTTLNLNDDLLHSAKDRAASRGVTLTQVVEEALRSALTETATTSFRLDLPVTRGHRLPLVDIDSNAAIDEYLDRRGDLGPA